MLGPQDNITLASKLLQREDSLVSSISMTEGLEIGTAEGVRIWHITN